MDESCCAAPRSGTSVFSGAVLLVLGVGVSAWCRGRWTKSFRSLLVWLGLVLMIASATPWPVWLYVMFGAASLGWFRQRKRRGCDMPRGSSRHGPSSSAWRA